MGCVRMRRMRRKRKMYVCKTKSQLVGKWKGIENRQMQMQKPNLNLNLNLNLNPVSELSLSLSPGTPWPFSQTIYTRITQIRERKHFVRGWSFGHWANHSHGKPVQVQTFSHPNLRSKLAHFLAATEKGNHQILEVYVQYGHLYNFQKKFVLNWKISDLENS